MLLNLIQGIETEKLCNSLEFFYPFRTAHFPLWTGFIWNKVHVLHTHTCQLIKSWHDINWMQAKVFFSVSLYPSHFIVASNFRYYSQFFFLCSFSEAVIIFHLSIWYDSRIHSSFHPIPLSHRFRLPAVHAWKEIKTRLPELNGIRTALFSFLNWKVSIAAMFEDCRCHFVVYSIMNKWSNWYRWSRGWIG